MNAKHILISELT